MTEEEFCRDILTVIFVDGRTSASRRARGHFQLTVATASDSELETIARWQAGARNEPQAYNTVLSELRMLRDMWRRPEQRARIRSLLGRSDG